MGSLNCNNKKHNGLNLNKKYWVTKTIHGHNGEKQFI